MQKQDKRTKGLPDRKKNTHFQNLKDIQDKTLIALYSQKNRTGIAIYDDSKNQITASSVVEVEANDFQNLYKFLAGYSSVQYIIPQRCSKDFLDNLKKINSMDKENDDEILIKEAPEDKEVLFNTTEDEVLDKSFYTISKADFDFQFVIDTLLSANYDTVIESDISIVQDSKINPCDKKSKMAYLRGVLDLDNMIMISALGGLLSFLFQTSKLRRNFNIEIIRMKQPQKNVYINMKTYNSLSILKEEIHPSQIKGKGRSKEGFSIFNLFDSIISTTHGTKLLRNWFLNPTYEIDILEERLYTVNFLLSRPSLNDFDKIRKSLKKTYDMAVVLRKFKNNSVTKDHWRKVEHSIESFLQIKMTLQSLVEEEIPSEKDKLLPVIISKILKFEDNNLLELQQIFVTALKFRDGSDRIEINAGINEDLDGLRKLYDNLDDLLTYYAKKELERLPESSNQKLSLTYMPHFGYLVSIPKENIESSSRGQTSSSLLEKEKLLYTYKSSSTVSFIQHNY